jgi:putative endonuclease
MTNYQSGHDAERVAAKYLEKHGYTIVALNWRHARAEIDIVAQKRPRLRANGPIVFFEVKYRKSDWQGRGLDYITPKKLEQMRFAAELWVTENKYAGEYAVGAIEMTDEPPIVTELIESLD